MKTLARKHMRFLILIMVGLIFSLYISSKLYFSKQEKDEEAFLRGAKEQIEIVREFMKGSFLILNSLEAFYSVSEFVSQEEFKGFTRDFLQQDHYLNALGWLVPVNAHEGIFRIEYRESLNANVAEMGMQKTIKNINGPEIFILEDGNVSGNLMVLKPFFDKDHNLKGLLLAEFDMDMLIRQALANENSHGMQLRIFKNQAGSQPVALNDQLRIFHEIFGMGGHEQWMVEVSAIKTMTWKDQWDVILLFISSLLFISFIGIHFLSRDKKEEMIQKEVKKRTDELQDANAKLKGTIAQLTEADELLKRKAIQFQLIYEATSLTDVHTLEEALHKCMDTICKVMSWPLGHIYVLNQDKTKLIATNQWHCSDRDRYALFMDVTVRTAFARGEGLPGRVWQSREPVWIEDINSDSNFPRIAQYQERNIKAAFAFPIIITGEIFAVMEFFHAQELEINSEFLKTIQNVGEQLSRVLENNAAQEELKKEKERLEIFQRVTVNREMEMIELKKENNELNRQLGKAPSYDLSFLKESSNGA